MQVNVQELEPCRVSVTVEVPADQVTETTQKARKELLRYITVPGFRRGKAPAGLANQFLKPEMVQEHTLELLLRESYPAALKEVDVIPFAEPKLDVKGALEEGQPFSFTAIVPTMPKVRLGQYQGLDVEYHPVTVTDDDVEAYLERLRKDTSSLREVDRAVADQDFVTLSVVELPAEGEPSAPRTLRVVADSSATGLEAAVVGKLKGEEVELAADDEAGTPARKGTVGEIRAFVTPDLDDEFATRVSDVTTIAELRDGVRRQLETQSQSIAEDELRTNLLNAIKRTSDVAFPRELLEAETAARMSRFMETLEESRTTLDMYLRRREKSLQEFETEIEASSREMITNQLLLEEVADKEKLLPAEEVEAPPTSDGEEEAPVSWLKKTWDFLKENNRVTAVATESPQEAK
ncbi:MAG TPA: trigger factor [Armatimonadota bacterium]|jgi:trigger factor